MRPSGRSAWRNSPRNIALAITTRARDRPARPWCRMRWRGKMPRDRGQHETADALKDSGQTSEPAAVIGQLHAMVREARTQLIDPTADNVDDCGRRLGEVASALRKLPAGLG